MENLKRITKNQLNFENIKDFIDIENEIAWVSFDFKGKNYKWNLRVAADWVDGALFDKVQELNLELNNSYKFTSYGLGQDGVIGYINEKEMTEFKKTTNIRIKWLNGIKDFGQ